MINTQPKTADAIRSLDPHSEFSIREGVITWITTPIDESKIATEKARLQTEWDSQDYARKRKLEYPPMIDYLDGIVKGDQSQIDKYIADCLAVKEKYPKGAN